MKMMFAKNMIGINNTMEMVTIKNQNLVHLFINWDVSRCFLLSLLVLMRWLTASKVITTLNSFDKVITLVAFSPHFVSALTN